MDTSHPTQTVWHAFLYHNWKYDGWWVFIWFVIFALLIYNAYQAHFHGRINAPRSARTFYADDEPGMFIILLVLNYVLLFICVCVAWNFIANLPNADPGL